MVALDLALGVLGGLVLALSAAFGCEYFDNSVKSSEEVEGFLQLPTLATIPNFALARPSAALPGSPTNGRGGAHTNGRSADGGELVVFHEPWSRIAEAFRSMRTAILFSAPGAPRVVAVPSSVAAEGTTVAS